MNLHGHPISKQLEQWWATHGGNRESEQWEQFLSYFTSNLGAKVTEMLAEHENTSEDGRKVFGMSKVGGCTRQAALKLLGHEGEPFSGSTQFTFFNGHVLECAALAMLRVCGYDIGDSQTPARIEPMLASFSDGVFTMHGVKTILSVKTAGYKKSGKKFGRKGTSPSDWERRGFPELPFAGVRKAQPGHWAQMQAEMHALDIKQALYLVLSKDIIKAMEGDPYLDSKEGNGSLSFYGEMVKYDPAFVENHIIPVWEQQYQFVQEGLAGPAFFISNTLDEYQELNPADTNWKPNADRTGTFNPCNYCDFVKVCAEVE